MTSATLCVNIELQQTNLSGAVDHTFVVEKANRQRFQLQPGLHIMVASDSPLT